MGQTDKQRATVRLHNRIRRVTSDTRESLCNDKYTYKKRNIIQNTKYTTQNTKYNIQKIQIQNTTYKIHKKIQSKNTKYKILNKITKDR